MQTGNISQFPGPFNPAGGVEHSMHDGSFMTTETGRTAPVGASLARALSFVVVALALAPVGAAAQGACGVSYTFDTGDTFAEIARQCGVSIPALLAANPGVVDERDLEVGARLRIPDAGAAQPSPVAACGSYYTVRTGDTLGEIAAKCGLTIPLLVAANPPFPSPLGVNAGMRVRIPDVSRAAVRDPATIATLGRAAAAVARADAARAESERSDSLAAEAAREPAADSAAIPAEDLVRVEGVLEGGPRCMRVRAPGGEVYAIAGELRRNFQAGDRVVLMGTAAEEHSCGTASPVLELRILYRAGR